MKHRVIAIVQARLQSERLPNKVLLKINGKPMLWHVLNRLAHCKELDGICVAIPRQDHKLHAWLDRHQHIHGKAIKCVTGSANNVLERYYRAATVTNVDVIVRITSDCPMIDPKIIDSVVKYFNDHSFDYVCNSNDNPAVYEKVNRDYRSQINWQTMDGFDVEIFSFMSLCNAFFSAKDKSDLEHVTPFIVRNGNVDIWRYDRQLPKFHLSVDTAEDLEVIRHIFTRLGNNFSMEKALEVYEINRMA